MELSSLLITELKLLVCILPIAHNQDLPSIWVLRHRASNISQKTDATTIVVSGRNQSISLSEVGELHLNLTPENWNYYFDKGRAR